MPNKDQGVANDKAYNCVVVYVYFVFTVPYSVDKVDRAWCSVSVVWLWAWWVTLMKERTVRRGIWNPSHMHRDIIFFLFFNCYYDESAKCFGLPATTTHKWYRSALRRKSRVDTMSSSWVLDKSVCLAKFNGPHQQKMSRQKTHLVQRFVPVISPLFRSTSSRWRRCRGWIRSQRRLMIHDQGSVHFRLALLQIAASFKVFPKVFDCLGRRVHDPLGSWFGCRCCSSSSLLAHGIGRDDQWSDHFGISTGQAHDDAVGVCCCCRDCGFLLNV